MFLFEHYQQADGSFAVPDVLRPYTGFDPTVEPRITPTVRAPVASYAEGCRSGRIGAVLKTVVRKHPGFESQSLRSHVCAGQWLSAAPVIVMPRNDDGVPRKQPTVYGNSNVMS